MRKPKALLIAEKKSVADDIKNVYNKISSSYPYELDIAYCAGHLIGLCTPDEYPDKNWKEWCADELPLVPDAWRKKVIKKDFYGTLSDIYQNGNYDYIINAGDAGREGQLIQMWVYEQLGVTCPILRYWADDTTAKTIEKALNNLRPNEDYQGLTNASILRAYLDWLCGMNYSRAASIALDRSSSLGRVMTPTLNMIVKRYWEIKNFSVEDFYELEAEFSCPDGVYKGLLLNPLPIEKNAYRFDNKSELEEIRLQSGTISSVQQDEKLHYAPPLFNLTDLQKECFRKFKMSPKKTLDIAESLYMKHLLSYPRTESKCLSSAQRRDISDILHVVASIPEFSKIVPKISESDIIRTMSSKKYCDDKKVSDHPALTPTTEKPNLGELTKQENDVYFTVVSRFLSIFLPPKKTLTTTILTTCGKYMFRTSGTVILDEGYAAYFDKQKEAGEILPHVAEHTSVSVDSLNIFKKQTVPPKPYNNATILSAMESAGRMLDDDELAEVLKESAGLGTPATRADILDKLITDGYIKNNQGNLTPSTAGIDLIGALEGQSIISIELTANWEKILKGVENNQYPFELVYQKMIQSITKNTKALLSLDSLGALPKDIVCQCPQCGRNIYESKKAFYCEGFLNEDSPCEFRVCKFLGGNSISPKLFATLCNGGVSKELTFHWKNNTQTTGRIYLKDGNYAYYKDVVGKCPKCGRDVLSKKNSFYCEGATKRNGNVCDFSMYNKIGTTTVPNDIAAQVFKNGVSDKLLTVKFKSGKSNKGLISVNPDQPQFFSLRVEKQPIEQICDCPYCHKGTVIHDGHYYKCSNNVDGSDICDFKIWDTIFNSTYVSPANLKKMFNKEITELSFKAKEGNYKYKKKVTLEYNPDKAQYIFLVEKSKR